MTVESWLLPSDLISRSVTIMRPNGVRGCEGLALWLGTMSGTRAEVSHVFNVHGPGFRAAPLQLQLSHRALDRLTDLCSELECFLIGQIHSHPGLFLELSDADCIYGIRRQDYLSLVCPFYAQRDTTSVKQCGVHVFDRGGYRRLAGSEIDRRIEVRDQPVVVVQCEVPA